MKRSYVVDTNVGVVANEKSDKASPECVFACAKRLLGFQSDYRVVLDSGHLILDEYRKRLSLSGKPGAGDAFLRWVWDNRFNSEHCDLVEIHARVNPRGEDYLEFPDAPELAKFDRADRKFAAAAIASPDRPSVLNAVDSDWWNFRDVLQTYGIEVEFLCPDVFGPNRRRKATKRKKRRP